MAWDASAILVSALSPPVLAASRTQWRRWSSSRPRATPSRALVSAETWVKMSIGGRLRFALTTCEVERTDQHVVLYAPVGAPGQGRDGLRDGPQSTFLRLENFADTCSPTVWAGADCLFVHRFGDRGRPGGGLRTAPLDPGLTSTSRSPGRRPRSVGIRQTSPWTSWSTAMVPSPTRMRTSSSGLSCKPVHRR